MMHYTNIHRLSYITGWCMLLLLSCSTGKPTVSASPDAIRRAVQQNEWVFSMQTVTPSGGRMRFPVGNYEVKLNGDTLTSHLPYFGRAYGGADVMNTQSVMMFTAAVALKEKKEERPGKWLVVLSPVDQRQIQSLFFNINENGTAQLNVGFTNRTGISYSGYVVPLKK